MKKFALSLFKTADEKLRSLSHKGSHSYKPPASTSYGFANGTEGYSVTPSTSTVTINPGRTQAPDVSPPPVPPLPASLQNLSCDQTSQSQGNIEPYLKSSVSQDQVSEDTPPPLHPRPRLSNMAERRLQRQGKTGSGGSIDGAKRRSRSEGPHGRRKARSSMHETSTPNKQQYKKPANERYSMFTSHLSGDEDVRGAKSGSDSQDSDLEQQQWTKNPLMVRKSRKSEKGSKTDKRRSVHNVEHNGNKTDRAPNIFQHPHSKDLFIYPGKAEPAQKTSKYQRMEENRKKRIEMTVTSDEECSPQLRISRLRQRAMLGSNMQQEPVLRENIEIVPNQKNKTSQNFHENGFNQSDNLKQERVSQYDENRLSKYDENYNIDNMNGGFYQDYAKQQGVRHNKLPNILPEYLPENRLPVNKAPVTGYHGNLSNQTSFTGSNQRQNVSMPTNFLRNQTQLQSGSVQQTFAKMPSESPSSKLRSFNEVKSNKPAPLKKAVEKIEIIPRSPDSSTDSLDDLIESNIQYLESEIESGKLKRQSGNFANVQKDKPVPVQYVKHDDTRSGQNVAANFRSRLQDPRGYTENKARATQNKNSVYNVPQPSFGRPGYKPSSGQVHGEYKHVPLSGSATYSPHMQRKHVDVTEDMSKSDTQLNNRNVEYMPGMYSAEKSYVPYPVMNQHTGNVTYVQGPVSGQEMSASDGDLGNMTAEMASGMFSDVEYDIVVSERIKKWEKKLTPREIEERKAVLNTIKEYESFSDSNQKDSVPDTPVEIRRELRQLMSPTSNSGVGRLSVNLTKSTSSISDARESPVTYFEPKVVSSETNLHRIFRVVQEPVPVRSAEMRKVNVENRKKKSNEAPSSHAQSMTNMTLSESEVGTSMQQSWPPMVVDSDSGIRKSWRTSRYEDEISELKELVSDNVRDIRKRFDSDVSEPGTRRETSPVPQSRPSQKPGTSTVTLNIKPATPPSRSPITIRRKLSDQSPHYTPPPVSPGIMATQGAPVSMATSFPVAMSTAPVAPTAITLKSEKKLPIYRSVPVEAKSKVTSRPVTMGNKRPVTSPQMSTSGDAPKPAPDVWSPNMESRKGLVSIERVKARTLQTIPFSEDPVWKEIEGLGTFERPEEGQREVNFDEIDELLRIATGTAAERARSRSLPRPDGQGHTWKQGDNVIGGNNGLSHANNVMTTSYNTTLSQVPTVLDKPRKLSDSSYPPVTSTNKYTFKPPAIQPLKLNSAAGKKSSTSALDEVLEDIRASLEKKPLSPKLMKNIDTPETNSSANPSLQSPLTKSSKAFVFSKESQKATPPAPPPRQKTPSSTTPGYDNTHPAWQPTTQPEVPTQSAQNAADVPYIDPDFTQFPYIINGNYHLDPDLLSEKLKGTGLVHDSSDEHSLANRSKAYNDAIANQYSKQIHCEPVMSTRSTSVQSKPAVHELDKSVDELRNLAQEVENKLSQIKTRIVSADENSLDSILLALRKFAPMAEQKYFSVKSKPDSEAEKLRKRKLEDALSELERMYESLDLDDKSLMDRASRREETARFKPRSEKEPAIKVQSMKEIPISSATNAHVNQINHQGDKNVMRRSQIEEVERQTQNEFEDITKSFQVLLDEVTKQCRSVAKGSGRVRQTDQSVYLGSGMSSGAGLSQFSGQRPPDEIRQEPPRQQLKFESSSQRNMQDSYNKAIRELENVAMGNVAMGNVGIGENQAARKPAQTSGLFLNLEKVNNQAYNQNMKNATVTSPSRNLDIQIQSRAVTTAKSTTPNLRSPAGPKPFVSLATEFKPQVTSTVAMETPSGSDNQEDVSKNTVTLQLELNNAKVKGQGRGGRFRKRGNIEHRKSMPAITRSVETQTVETQTEPAPSVTEMKEKFEQIRKSSLQDFDSDSSPDVRAGRGLLRKLSGTKVSDLADSSEDDTGRRKKDSKFRHSLSAPDIVSLLDCFNEKYYKERKQGEKQSTEVTKLERSTSETAEAATGDADKLGNTPLRKPPVYPVWQYPGQGDLPSPKKTETKRQPFTVDRDFTITASDNEDRTTSQETRFGATGGVNFEMSEVVTRRRTCSVGAVQDFDQERPKSFHELVLLFEHSPQRLEKLRTCGLRKCASEDSMMTDLILQKIYHSESDLISLDGHSTGKKPSSGSGLKLALELKTKYS
ncbi:uncharacterized protein LOC128240797 isoform X2 [Mya arenaria]|uniref:uncharacterized protein LOC128240797 isoform X2 n=1 Tax=Mya arenaria TaxID=6604 RepID=UPI0022E2F85D|nr:uncharacterized protein LOC128240797 isoform X2 [Mya arenaria]